MRKILLILFLIFSVCYSQNIKFDSIIKQDSIKQDSTSKMMDEPKAVVEPKLKIVKSFLHVSPLQPIPTLIVEPLAKLTYVISDTMMIGKTYTVDITLSNNMTNEQLVKVIDGFNGKTLIDTMINITPIMRARLLDPGKCFKQESITSEIQNTTNRKLIRWQWQVIPIVEGDIFLTISVDNYIDDTPQNVNIYNGKTYVYAIHTWYGDIWNWVSMYWDKITYVIGGVLAIFGWLYKEKLITIFKKKV